jgi:stringent starvation protein B
MSKINEASLKPYLIRALYECYADNDLAPHIGVQVSELTQVPRDFVKNGHIVLNISMTATHQLSLQNDWITFSARFKGMPQEVAVPMGQVVRIFAPDSDFGMEFAVTETPVTPANKTAPPNKDEPPSPPKKVSHLTVVK